MRYRLGWGIYLALGWQEVRFEAKTQVVSGLHQILGGSDQNLIDWAGHGPRSLHQGCGLVGENKREEKSRGDKGRAGLYFTYELYIGLYRIFLPRYFSLLPINFLTAKKLAPQLQNYPTYFSKVKMGTKLLYTI